MDNQSKKRSKFIGTSSIFIVLAGFISAGIFMASFEGDPALESVLSATVALSMLLLAQSALVAISRESSERMLTLVGMGLLLLPLMNVVLTIHTTHTFLRPNLMFVYLAFGLITFFISSIALQNYAITKDAKRYLSKGVPILAIILATLTIWLQIYANQSYNERHDYLRRDNNESVQMME